MECPPFEFVKDIEEHSHEGVDVSGGLRGCRDVLAVVRIRPAYSSAGFSSGERVTRRGCALGLLVSPVPQKISGMRIRLLEEEDICFTSP